MLEDFMQWLGYGLCHQLPERSFVAGGLQLPVCARDTGIYFGFVISFALIALLHRRKRARGFPRPVVWAVMIAFIGLMGWDGVTSYAGLRETTNDIRLLSGLAAGFAMAALVTPVLNDVLWVEPSDERVLSPAWRLVSWTSAVPVSAVLVKYGLPYLGMGFAVVNALAIILTLALINLVIVGMLPAFDRRAHSIVDVVPAFVLATAAAFAEIWFAGFLRGVLLGLAG